jgi:hypothetical protein
MNPKSAKRILIFLAVSFSTVAFIFFAPGILGPMYAHEQERESLEQSLTACPPDEVRMAVYFGKTGVETATFSFKTKMLTGSNGNPNSSWSAFDAGGGGAYNIHFSFQSKPFTDDQVDQLKKLLATMPPAIDQGSSVSSSYRDQFHLAFYQATEQRIYHYAKTEETDKIRELCAALQVVPHLTDK